MKAQDRLVRYSREEPRKEICLGLVILTKYQRLTEAIAQLDALGMLQLAEAQGARVPACAVTMVGDDKDLIAEIEALPAVSRVEVAFAQVIEEEDS